MKKQLIAVLLIILMGCANKSGNPTPVPPAPGQAVLSSPAQNAVCITGSVISATESDVTFSWTAAANTVSYRLFVKNLLTSTTVTKNTGQTQLVVTLLRNTPYAWWIVSVSAQTTATSQSDTWKFYNAGPGVVSYAPFPAVIVAPGAGSTVSSTRDSVSLAWQGSSVTQSAISGYDIYFGTSSKPQLLKAGVTGSPLRVQVKSDSIYYWKVITTDVYGNTSDSGLANFKVR